MITVLGVAERDRVWQAGGTYVHYMWVESMWRAFSADPRTSPGVQSIPAAGQFNNPDRTIRSPRGFVDRGPRETASINSAPQTP